MAKLGDICKIQSGGTPSKNRADFFGGNIPWITTIALNKEVITADDAVEWITDKAIVENSAKIVPPNSIMVGTRVGIGKVAINAIPMATSQDIVSLININTDYWDKGFLCKFILSKKEFLMSKARGATIKGIQIETLSSLEVPDLELSTQRRIASLLDKVTDLISKRRAQLEKLDLLVKSRFVEMFGDPIENNLNWKTDCLKRVTQKIGSGATPKGGKESYQNEGISLIRSMNVHDSKFEYKDLAHIDSMQAEQLNNVIVEKYDVLINITGASVARSCVVPENVLPARVNQHVSIIRCCDERLNHIFVNCLFLNESYKRKLLSIGEAGGATRQAITKQQLEDLIVILPPIELQKQFASFVQQTETTKSTIQKSLETLETLKKALMQEYFE